MGEGEASLTVAGLARAVRGVDPGAFVVPGRIVRRAIKHDRELPTITVRVPHRGSYVVAARRALEVIDRAELGLAPGETVPATILLIAAAHLNLGQEVMSFARASLFSEPSPSSTP